ncbi:MAG: hypothetical protein QNJ72_05040 [Pleurocapsa sp. MO_226.B13]|nr:hypothetical protein [Pleurocapsa sp. MO_226.B13]
MRGSQHSKIRYHFTISECCEKNSRLYNALNQWMSQPADWSHLCHLKTCIWMIVALIHAGNVNLTKWSMYIPCRGHFAQSRQRRKRALAQ